MAAQQALLLQKLQCMSVRTSDHAMMEGTGQVCTFMPSSPCHHVLGSRSVQQLLYMRFAATSTLGRPAGLHLRIIILVHAFACCAALFVTAPASTSPSMPPMLLQHGLEMSCLTLVLHISPGVQLLHVPLQLWAFSRDNLVPGSKYMRRLDKISQTPATASECCSEGIVWSTEYQHLHAFPVLQVSELTATRLFCLLGGCRPHAC